MPDYTGIVTHNDFDGLGSAALLSWAFDIEDIRFAGPITIANAEISISREHIVCDLPYPLECGLWFDHHAGNVEELKLRGLDPRAIPGRFAEAPSCVRVVYDFLSETDDLPEDFSELARVADLVDSFAYPDLKSWRADTPANRVDRAIKAASENRRAHDAFLREVTFLLRDVSMAEAAADPKIVERAARYAREEEIMLDHLQKYRRSLDGDAAGELYVVDISAFSNPVRLDKKLIGLLDPRAKGYVELKPVFRGGRKAHDLSVSLSLALTMQRVGHTKDVGEIMRELNLGDGHKGAAAGVLRGESPRDFQRARDELPQRILDLWKKQ